MAATAHERAAVHALIPSLELALDAAALLLTARRELDREEQRHLLRGMRTTKFLRAAQSKEHQAALALKKALADHWCPMEERV